MKNLVVISTFLILMAGVAEAEDESEGAPAGIVEQCRKLLTPDQRKACCDKISDGLHQIQCLVDIAVPLQLDEKGFPPAVAHQPPYRRYDYDSLLPPNGLFGGQT